MGFFPAKFSILITFKVRTYALHSKCIKFKGLRQMLRAGLYRSIVHLIKIIQLHVGQQKRSRCHTVLTIQFLN